MRRLTVPCLERRVSDLQLRNNDDHWSFDSYRLSLSLRQRRSMDGEFSDEARSVE